MRSNKNILYIFGSGRREKILTKNTDSSEFFYGYFHMESKFKYINSIEMLPNDTVLNKKQNFIYFFDKVLRKLTNLPFYIHLILNKINFIQIKKADLIIATNDRLAISALPMIIFSKLNFKKKKFLVIVMGLFSKRRDRKVVIFFQKLVLNFIIKKIHFLIFLGKGEYEYAKNMYPRFKDKFRFVPFGLNLDFWSPTKKYSPEEKDYILFVGNDGNRDFDKVINIANSMNEVKVKIITSQNISNKSVNNNVEIIHGDWHKTTLSDYELKNYYENALLTFLPLKETFQPSGQSVSLQSMSLGIPVVITKTMGFWDLNRFDNFENIIFVEDSKLESWTELLKSTINNKALLNKLSKNSIKTIEKFYNQEDFFNKMEKLF